MKKILLGLMLIGAVGVASAEQTISESHKKAALELLKVMDMGNQFSDALVVGIDAQIEANPSIAHYRQAFLDFYDQHVNWKDVKGRFAILYASNFTQAEIEKLTDFYQTELGQKVAKKTPDLMAQGMQLGQQLVKEKQTELMRMLQEADKNQ
ncbi:hypothetical protein KS2013_767 [Kangiella sediminilitoris]|uniref:DUF2059 domain-containing protein n=2 Tax=Kangiella sediminilitoris TaxID=1144748 RepID=A0A1B3B9L0_9GAMM|nr:hypothetical protein KS2013_767 [Kangiella sediminilitoris]